jgi:hypothetical protein
MSRPGPVRRTLRLQQERLALPLEETDLPIGSAEMLLISIEEIKRTVNGAVRAVRLRLLDQCVGQVDHRLPVLHVRPWLQMLMTSSNKETASAIPCESPAAEALSSISAARSVNSRNSSCFVAPAESSGNSTGSRARLHIPLTVPEIKRILAALTARPLPPPHVIHWDAWTRRHQARARWFHHRARLKRDYVLVS